MSSRRLRKIQQEKELEDAKRRAVEEADDDESADEPVSSNNKISAFSAFAALDEQEDELLSEPDPESDPDPVSVPAPKPQKPKKKKKKKKKKAQDKLDEKDDESDEIEAALRELNLKRPPVEAPLPLKTPQDLQWDRICNLLKVHTQHLKVGNEMRNLFGRAATENHDDAGGRPGRNRQRHQVSILQKQLSFLNDRFIGKISFHFT